MTGSYSKKLFENYHTTHIVHLDSSREEKQRWFDDYVVQNYLPHLGGVDRSAARVLEIGCNQGFVLAALRSAGFPSLHGIDLSPGDLDIARTLLPEAELTTVAAADYLEEHPARFDVIAMKAVLEHVRKDDVIPLLESIRRSLRPPGGVVVIDVPNMDWLFASHERYMDFTHEVGFTSDSLRQIMNNVFPSVEVVAVDNIPSTPLVALKKRVSRFILHRLLSWADPQGASNPIWARTILGIGRLVPRAPTRGG